MTNWEKTKASWLGYEIAYNMGWRAESQECLKEHFRYLEEVLREQRPELYEKSEKA